MAGAASDGGRELAQTLEIAADHPAFAGHFPGRPIVPGVVLLDLALLAVEQWLAPEPAVRREIVSAKFLSPLLPGEPLAIHARLLRSAAGDELRFELTSGQRRVASGHCRYTLPPAA